MEFLKNLFGFKEKQKTTTIDPSELIKQSTSEFRLKNYEAAINLILKAISIEFQPKWYDKLANYYYKINDFEKAFHTLDLLEKKTEIMYINQFSYDFVILNIKAIWEKYKVTKLKYEATIHIKSVIDYCMNGDYNNYPSFNVDFNNDEINTITNEYLSLIKPIVLDIDKVMKKLKSNYDENYLDYDYNNLSIYETNNELAKNSTQVKELVNELKKHKMPFFDKI